MADEAMRYAARAQHRAHAGAQARAVLCYTLQRIGLGEDFQRLLGRRERHRVRGIGAAVSDAAAELAHDFFTAGEHRDGIAVGDCLGKSAQVRIDAVEFLNATARDAKAGLDLVDQEHDTVLVAQLARGAQVFGLGRNPEAVAHDRLDKQAGDRVPVALQHILELIGVVRLHEVRELPRAQRHALAVWIDLRIADLLPLIHRRVPHGRVEQTVVTAFQDDVVVPAGVGTRQSQRRHHRLGPGVGKSHQLSRWHHLRDAFRDPVLALGGERKHPAHLHTGAGGRVDARIRVTQDRGPVTHAIVDIHVVIDIGHARTAPVLHVNGPVLAPEAKVGRDPQRQARERAPVVFVVPGQDSGHGCTANYLDFKVLP